MVAVGRGVRIPPLGWAVVLALFMFGSRWHFAFVDGVWPDESRHAYIGQIAMEDPGALLGWAWKISPPLVFGLISLLGHVLPIELAARVVAPLFSALAVFALFLLGRSLRSPAVGLIAAVLLCVSNRFWLFGTRILLDVPHVALLVLCVWCLVRLEQTRQLRFGVALGLSTAAVLFAKNKGVVVLGLLGFHALFAYGLIPWMRGRSVAGALGARLGSPAYLAAASLVVVSFAGWIAGNVSVGGSPLPPMMRTVETSPDAPPFAQLAIVAHVVAWPVLLLSAPGLWVLALRPGDDRIAVFAWVAMIAAASLGVPYPDVRHLLEVVPLACLLAAVSLDALATRMTSRGWRGWAVVVAIVAVWAVGALVAGSRDLARRGATNYTGLKQAGIWLAEHAEPDATAYVQSLMTMRYYGRRHLGGPSGTLRVYPKTFESFAREIDDESERVYAQIDRWEYDVPDWLDAPLPELRSRFESLGFRVVAEIERPREPPVVAMWLVRDPPASQTPQR